MEDSLISRRTTSRPTREQSLPNCNSAEKRGMRRFFECVCVKPSSFQSGTRNRSCFDLRLHRKSGGKLNNRHNTHDPTCPPAPVVVNDVGLWNVIHAICARQWAGTLNLPVTYFHNAGRRSYIFTSLSRPRRFNSGALNRTTGVASYSPSRTTILSRSCPKWKAQKKRYAIRKLRRHSPATICRGTPDSWLC